MKSIKFSFLIIAVILVFGSSPLKAQRSHLSLSFSPVLPLSNLKDHASWGFLSGRIGYNFDITHNLSWNLSAAINKFGTQTVTVDIQTNAEYESDLAFIPITTGLQYFLNIKNNRIYLMALGGYYLPSAGFEEGDWGVSPGVGLQLPFIGNRMKLDISMVYNHVFGGTTKQFTAYSQFGGSVTTQTWFNSISYLTVNIGIVIGK